MSDLHKLLVVLVGAMVTTGGLEGTLWPLLCPRRGPIEALCGVETGGVLETLWARVWPRRGPTVALCGVETGELWLVLGEETGEDSPLRTGPLGSSACLANLRRAAANPELAAWDAVLPLVSGVRGVTVAVLRVAVEIIPNDGELLESWFIP